jgi:hypothetical protein
MKSFGEYKEKTRIEEGLVPEIREILKHLDEAIAVADDGNMSATMKVIENARQEIIKLSGK